MLTKPCKTEVQCYEYRKDINILWHSIEEMEICEGKLINFEKNIMMLPNTFSGKDGLSKKSCLAFFQTLDNDLVQCVNYSLGKLKGQLLIKKLCLLRKKIVANGTLEIGDNVVTLYYSILLYITPYYSILLYITLLA